MAGTLKLKFFRGGCGRVIEMLIMLRKNRAKDKAK